MAWWQQSTSKSSGNAVDMDEEEAVIDLTSDTEDVPSPAVATVPAATAGVEVMSTWALNLATIRIRMY